MNGETIKNAAENSSKWGKWKSTSLSETLQLQLSSDIQAERGIKNNKNQEGSTTRWAGDPSGESLMVSGKYSKY